MKKKRFSPLLDDKMTSNRREEIVEAAANEAPFDATASLQVMRKLVEDTHVLNAQTLNLNIHAEQILTQLCDVAEKLEQPVV